MRIAIPLLTALLAVAAVPAFATDPPTPSTLAFKHGGTIRMNLSSGAVEVLGTADERITVTSRSTRGEIKGHLKVDLRDESGGKEAAVEITGPSNHMRYRIEVPRRSNVVMRMSAGDCSVRGIHGDVTASLLAGNLEIRIDEAGDYRSVRGSVTSGGLVAKPWNIDKGGLFRSFDVKGTGTHEIDAKVLAGQLVIRRE